MQKRLQLHFSPEVFSEEVRAPCSFSTRALTHHVFMTTITLCTGTSLFWTSFESLEELEEHALTNLIQNHLALLSSNTFMLCQFSQPYSICLSLKGNLTLVPSNKGHIKPGHLVLVSSNKVNLQPRTLPRAITIVHLLLAFIKLCVLLQVPSLSSSDKVTWPSFL